METQKHLDQDDLTIHISPELQQRLRIAAARRNISLEKYIEDMLEQIVLHEAKGSQQELQPMTREAYENILKWREQIKQDRQGKPFDDSTDIIRQMREERSRHLADL